MKEKLRFQFNTEYFEGIGGQEVAGSSPVAPIYLIYKYNDVCL